MNSPRKSSLSTAPNKSNVSPSSSGATKSHTSGGKKRRSSSRPSSKRREQPPSDISGSLQDLSNDIISEYPQVKLSLRPSHGMPEELPQFVQAVQTRRGFISKERENKRIAASHRLSEKLNQVSDQDFGSSVRVLFDKLSALAQGLLAGMSLWQLLQISSTAKPSWDEACHLIKVYHGMFYFFSTLAVLQLMTRSKEIPAWKTALILLAFLVGAIANSIAAQEDDGIFLNCTANLTSSKSSFTSDLHSLDWHSLNSNRTVAAIIGFVFSIILS